MTATIPGFLADQSLAAPGLGSHRVAQFVATVGLGTRPAQDDAPCRVSRTSSACRTCWSDCISGCANARDCFTSCRLECGGQPPDPGPVGAPAVPTTPANVWTSIDCTGYRQVQVCGVPYPTLSDCIATCSSGVCTPMPGGYGCCSTREVCVGTTTCTHYDGSCTGSFLTGSTTRCVASPSGFSRCAGGPNQFPWVVECTNGSRSSGVGFCLF